MTLISRSEDTYPQRLRGLDMAPERLWMRGSFYGDRPAVAIVGARAATGSGQGLAFGLSAQLCRAGVDVISGGAIGIDAAAHSGALSVTGGGTGTTLVVLGTGIDVVYPRHHFLLFEEAARRGCLLSMFPLGTPAKTWHFPARNHLIAALCDVVLVVESQLGSGSRITARSGWKLGRTVAAVPRSPGTDELIREGATPIQDAADVLRLLDEQKDAIFRSGPPGPIQIELPLSPAEKRTSSSALSGPLMDQAERVRTVLSTIPCDLGELSVRTGLPTAACAAAVVDLELHGFCTRVTGGRYIALEHAS